MRIAVIILNYNSLDDSRKCISYLKRQEGVELEIILVDNCSSDAKAAEVFCKEQGCTFIAGHENRGYNAGNNIGLRYAAKKGYKYAMIANPDMEFPQTNYVSCLFSIMEQDPNVVVVGSDILGPNNIHQNPVDVDSFWSEFLWPLEVFKHKLSPQKKRYVANSGYCQMLSGCCFGIRMSLCKQLNFFDENVFLYCEEPILAYQVKSLGLKLYYTASCYAIHRHIESAKGSLYKRLMILCDSRNYKNKYYSDYNLFQRQLLYCSHKLRKWLMGLLAMLEYNHTYNKK